MNELPYSRDFASLLGERLNRRSPLDVLRLDGYQGDYFAVSADRSLTAYVSSGGWSMLDLLSKAAAEPAVLEAIRAQSVRGRAAERSAITAASGFLSALPHALPAPQPFAVPLRYPEVRSLGPSWEEAAARWGVMIRDAVFALQHQLAPVVVIVDPSQYDTHLYNLPGQTNALQIFAAALSRLLGCLRATRTEDGIALAEQVGILISSEIGRFPILNGWAGKDHLPEIPVLFWGPGIAPGSYGRTDERMLATPISYSTGRHHPGGTNRVPSMDELGATVFEWFGVKDSLSSGYPGARLDFLLSG
jgi:hypothetical protein